MREDVLALVQTVALIGGGFGTLEPSGPRRRDAVVRTEEGRERTLVDEVGSVRAESEDRLSVHLRRHAQVYFLYRADQHFETSLRILRAAAAEARHVRLTFLEYSGRVVAVEWAAPPPTGQPIE